MHCCIFPKSPFDLPANLSVQPWELMDSRTFRSFVTGAEFCAEADALDESEHQKQNGREDADGLVG